MTLMTDKSADHAECGETRGNYTGFSSEIPTCGGVMKLKLIRYNISHARLKGRNKLVISDCLHLVFL